MRLKFAGLWFLIAAATISLIFNMDPTRSGFGTNDFPVLKYLPYELSLVSLIIFMVSIPAKFSIIVFMVASFITVMMAGSLYSLLFIGMVVEETYLGRALGGIVFLTSYYLCFDKTLISIFMKYYSRVFLLVSLMMLLILVLYRLDIMYVSLVQMYHVESVLIVSSAFLVDKLLRGQLFRNFLFFLLIGSGFLIFKATNSILSVAAFSWKIRSFFHKVILNVGRQSSHIRIVFYLMLSVVSFLLILLFGYLIQLIIVGRVTGRENVVREFSLSLRWDEFLSNPFVGDLFTGSPLIDFGHLHIPSHLDLLDLLASGGLITVVLFYFPVLYLIKKTIKPSLKNKFVSWQLFLFIALLMTMIVNPVIEVPRMGFIFFLSFGLLCGFVARKNGRMGENCSEKIF